MLSLHFPGYKSAEETLWLLLYLRYFHDTFKYANNHATFHCNVRIAEGMNSILSNTACRFSLTFLSDLIEHTKEQYSELQIRFENAYQDADSTLGFSSTTFWLHDYTTMDLHLKEKARENEALGRCPSNDCPLRKMVN